jgi:hypothetical protein
MANVLLNSNDQDYNISNDNDVIFGQAGGNETINIQTGVTGIVLDQNVEGVTFAGNVADFTYQQQGNQLLVYSGTDLVATVPVQVDENGSQLTFTDGTFTAEFGEGAVLELGGTEVPSDAPGAVEPGEDPGDDPGDDPGTPGETIELTTADDVVGLDAEEGFVTTENDDTIEGVSSSLTSTRTLNADDIIDGGDGEDTLAVDVQGNFTGFSVDGGMENVEIVELTNNGSIGRTFNTTGITGAEAYNIDATGAAVNLADLMTSDAEFSVSNQATGTMTVSFDTESDVQDNTDDAMSLVLTDVGTETADATFTINDIEELTVEAVGENYAAFAANDTVDMIVTGAGDLEISQVSTALATFDAATAEGDLVVDLTNTVATITAAALGSGDDELTIATEDVQINGELSGGPGADTLVLTGDGTEDTLAYNMGGFDTVSLGDVGVDLLFSGTNVSGIETIEISDDLNNDVSFANMGSADLAFELGEQTNTVEVTSNNSGTATVNMTASDDAVDDETYEDVDTEITANSASGLFVDVNQYLNFTGTLNANGASSVEVDVDGTLTGAVISATSATGGTLETGADASTMDLVAGSLTDLTVTAGGDLDIDVAATDLTSLESLIVDTSGIFQFSNGTNDLESIATVELSGSGADAEVDFTGVTLGDGATNDYPMTITASGLRGGLTFDDIDVAAGQDITIDLENFTGVLANAGTGIGSNTAGRNVTISTDGAARATTFGTIDATGTVDITAGSLGTFTVGAITADDVIIDAWSNLGTVAYGVVTAEDSVTFTGSEVQTNTLTITASATSTTLDVELNSGVQDDTYQIDGGAAQTEITITGESAGGTDTLTVNSATGGAEDVTVDASGLSGIEATINGGTDVNTLTGGDADDTLVTGGGSDVLTGNDGDDTFEITGGQSVGEDGVEITDFESAGDLIRIDTTASIVISTGGPTSSSLGALVLGIGTTGGGTARAGGVATGTLGALVAAGNGGAANAGEYVSGASATAALVGLTFSTLANSTISLLFLDTDGTDQGLYLIQGEATGTDTANTGATITITAVSLTNTVNVVLVGSNDIVAGDITFI